jgi:hypothetical protein
MTIPTTAIQLIEVDLMARGYQQRFWRRGVMGTRVFAKEGERVVIVRNAGVDRDVPGDAPASVDEWFVRLETALGGLIRGAKLTDLFLCGAESLQVPQRFLDWCKAMDVRVHTDSASFLKAS